jgi:hypothetical protein
LNDLAVDDPRAFIREDLHQYLPVLPRRRLAELQLLRDAVSKEGRVSYETSSAHMIARKALSNAGIDAGPAASETGQALVGRFYADLADWRSYFQREHNRPPSEAEVQQRAGDMVVQARWVQAQATTQALPVDRQSQSRTEPHVVPREASPPVEMNIPPSPRDDASNIARPAGEQAVEPSQPDTRASQLVQESDPAPKISTASASAATLAVPNVAPRMPLPSPASIALRVAPVIAAAGPAAALALPLIAFPTNSSGRTFDLGDGLRARQLPGQTSMVIERRVGNGLLGVGEKWEAVDLNANLKAGGDGRPVPHADLTELEKAIGPEAVDRLRAHTDAGAVFRSGSSGVK